MIGKRFLKGMLAIGLTLLLVLLCFCVAANAEAPKEEEREFDLSVKGLRIGVESGTVQDQLVQTLYPQAEIVYTDKLSGYNAVARGMLDCFIYDKKQMELAVANGLAGVAVLDQTVGGNTDIALGISDASEIPELAARVNELLSALREDGTLEDMYDRWVVRGSRVMPEITLPQLPEYHLTVGTTGIVEPYSFYQGTELTGYDIELSYRLAAGLNASLSFELYDYGSILEAAHSGKVDLIAANLQVTSEGAEAVCFSVPLFQEENGILVRDTTGSANGQMHGAVRWQDYNGRRIGVLTGPLMEDTAARFFPDSEYLLYDSYPDCAAALLAGKIDAFLGDEPGMKSLHAQIPEIDYIHDRLTENNYSFAFRKDDPESAALCAELNAFLAQSWSDGTMQELEDVWLGEDDAKKLVDMSDLTGANGTIRVVTTSTDMPWSYVKDGKNVGYDIDLVVRFCREKGYALELGDVDFAGRIPAIQSGRYDFTTDMNVTPEREEQVLFSDPTSHGGIVLAVASSELAPSSSSGENAQQRSADAHAQKQPGVKTGGQGRSLSFLDGIRASFEKTFIRENRWQLFLKGTGTTLLITVLSILFGTILGFTVYVACRNGNPVVTALTRFFVWLVQGLPVVVLLMILYYIIFAKSSIDGAVVAVAGFTLVFGAAVYGMLCAGVGAVGKSQSEAAYALGYGNLRTFFRIILPQAIPHFLPAYKGEITAMIKATAVVGYITVQDLTKMGDIVRGRTYEAFFPLIAVAVIYFILAALLTFLVGRIEIRVDPRRRKKETILRGIETHD